MIHSRRMRHSWKKAEYSDEGSTTINLLRQTSSTSMMKVCHSRSLYSTSTASGLNARQTDSTSSASRQTATSSASGTSRSPSPPITQPCSWSTAWWIWSYGACTSWRPAAHDDHAIRCSARTVNWSGTTPIACRSAAQQSQITNFCSAKYGHCHSYHYFASAAVAVDSSHMTASSSASRSRFSLPTNFVNGHVSTMWFTSVTGHNHRNVIGRDPICAS